MQKGRCRGGKKERKKEEKKHCKMLERKKKKRQKKKRKVDKAKERQGQSHSKLRRRHVAESGKADRSCVRIVETSIDTVSAVVYIPCKLCVVHGNVIVHYTVNTIYS